MASNIHCLDFHKKCLENLCRICSKRVQTCDQINRKATPRLCVNSRDKIYVYYGIDISSDEQDIHPAKICNQCFYRMKNVDVLAKSNKMDSAKYLGEKEKAGTVSRLWKPHKRIDCNVCNLYSSQMRKGRTRKVSTKGRPKKKTATSKSDGNIFDHLFPSSDMSNKYETDSAKIPTELLKTYVCQICQGIYSIKAVKTTCDHYFCADCLSNYFKHSETDEVACPICSNPVTVGEVKPVEERFQTQLLALDVKCKKCSHVCTLQTLTSHSCDSDVNTNDDQFASISEPAEIFQPMHSTPKNKLIPCSTIEVQTSPTLFSDESLKVPTVPSMEKSLSRSLSSPLTKNEERLHTHLTKRKLNFSKTKSIIKCKTGGQPIVLKKLVKARKSSLDVSSPLKRKRAREVATYRSAIAGNTEESQNSQQTSELKALTRNQRLNICSRAGIRNKSFMSKRISLALKTVLRLSWNQHRKQKQYLTKFAGIKYESEKKERAERKVMLGDHLQLKKMKVKENNDTAHNSSGGFIEKTVSVVDVTDLSTFVMKRVNNYRDEDKLVWKEGMPQNEVWIKFGGDHGGNSFKLCLQVCNVEKPNAKENTVSICCMPAKDLYPNLESLASLYSEQISKLQEAHWNNKKIRVFLFGDYAFLASLYGISGARGKHFCLWCHLKYEDIQVPLDTRGKAKKRKLRTMIRDNKRFVTEGKANLVQAGNFNNVIHKPLWNIPLSHVCPPYLHILLGIVKRHHDMFEQELHEVDIEFAEIVSLSKAKLETALFHTYIADLRAKRKLLNHLGFLKVQRETDSDLTSKEKAKLKLDIEITEKKVQKCKPTLPIQGGPLVAVVLETLKRQNIVQQAYHSRSFIGNHCSKYIRSKVQDKILVNIQEKNCELTNNVELNEKVREIGTRFHNLNMLFEGVHREIGSMKGISRDKCL